MDTLEILKNVIGYSATVLGTSLMLPQVYKSLVTKSVKDISWGMLILYVSGCILWLIYGILISAKPLAIANGIAFVIGIFQIFLKIKFKN